MNAQFKRSNDKCSFYFFLPESLAKSVPGPCNQLHCKYGAICKESNGRSQCFCEIRCPAVSTPSPVCGSDGNTYATKCQMSVFSCRYQKSITLRQQGPCKPGKLHFQRNSN
ncbi:kazal-like domain-containing protein [Trichonephila inaurata madagascariensis]|uniref:Kazal-like domain-containing protein n=1 Tax=Trichonephila inaurata madagascariensis TaxID=2747483 RepID=A0A8X7C412_9ARAC|nr:kazal-like domain-containing protein [Trichonephila inaurata madagascariensis]